MAGNRSLVATNRLSLVSFAAWFTFCAVGCASSVVGQEFERDQDRIVDHFRNSMRKEWRWKRENTDGWKLTDSGLQVLVEPGNLWGKANDAKNVLLHPVPDAWRESVEVTVQLEHRPEKRWEQANLVWYYSGSTMVKLGLEIEHGKTNIVMGREQGDRTKTIAIIPYAPEAVQLRMVVSGGELHGFYRKPGTDQWQPVGETSLPAPESDLNPQVSLQFYQGEPDSNRWATVNQFEMKGH